jgi:hypothetical protein
MGKRIMMVEGMDGQIELLADRVVIHRQGLWNMFKYGMNARREIPLGAISEVSFRDANAIMFGQIDFMRAGGRIESKKKGSDTAVKFNRQRQPEFMKLKEQLFEMIDQYARNRPGNT